MNLLEQRSWYVNNICFPCYLPGCMKISPDLKSIILLATGMQSVHVELDDQIFHTHLQLPHFL